MATLENIEKIHQLLTYGQWKGLLDRLLALLLITILFPFIALIAIGIRLDSRGWPIFTQKRVGKDGCIFTIYKFRTMRVNNDDGEYKEYVRRLVNEDVPYRTDHQGKALYKVVDDTRVTRFGALLRKTNLDELPQIFNVLKGEMSFIGPRPDIPFAVEMYGDWHRKRLCATPGISGLWQVSGRSGRSFDDMVQLDIDYIENQSLLLDSKIVLQTMGVVLGRDGSYQSRKEMQDG